MGEVTHKAWLDNEYKMFIQALNESTLENFQDNPMVIRMLGTVEEQKRKFEFYAPMILERNPKSICEIGGGSGLFFVTLKQFGYSGSHYIYDLPEVQKFQQKFIRSHGYDYEFNPFKNYDFCVSLYALGEFDDDLKQHYISEIINYCPHGLVVWNPHSGASDKIDWFCNIEPEPLFTMEGNKLLTW